MRHCHSFYEYTEISKIGLLSWQPIIGYLPDHWTTDAQFTTLVGTTITGLKLFAIKLSKYALVSQWHWNWSLGEWRSNFRTSSQRNLENLIAIRDISGFISAIFLLLSVNEIFTHIQAATENLLICSMIEHGFASLASLYNTIDELTYYLLTYQVQVQFSWVPWVPAKAEMCRSRQRSDYSMLRCQNKTTHNIKQPGNDPEVIYLKWTNAVE